MLLVALRFSSSSLFLLCVLPVRSGSAGGFDGHDHDVFLA